MALQVLPLQNQQAISGVATLPKPQPLKVASPIQQPLIKNVIQTPTQTLNPNVIDATGQKASPYLGTPHEHTVTELGWKVKQKYPDYADLSDEELGQKMKAKFPDYADFQDAPQIEQPQLDTLGKIGLGIKQSFGLAPGSYAPIPNPINIAKGIAEPALKGGATAVRTIQSTPDVVRGVFGNEEALQRANETMAKPLFGQKTLVGSSNLENTGTALNAASNLVGIKGELPAIINNQTSKATLTGGLQGAIGGGGQYLINEQNPTFGGFAKATGQGAFTGGVTGYAATKAQPLFTSPKNDPRSLYYKAIHPIETVTPDILSKDVQTLRTEKINQGLESQNTRLKTADKAFKENTKTFTDESGKKNTITPADTLAKYKITPEVDKGTIKMGDYKLGEGALGEIKTQVENLDAEIDANLTNSGTHDLEILKNEAIAKAKADPFLKRTGAVQPTVNKLISRFDDYIASYGDKIDNLELNEIRKVANYDYSPETHDVSRIVGDLTREKVYNATPDLKTKKLLQEQGNLLAARNYAQKLNGTKVVGGRLGNYAMRGLGAMIGSTVDKLPIAGPLIGMLGGEYAARGLQQAQFRGPLIEAKAYLLGVK